MEKKDFVYIGIIVALFVFCAFILFRSESASTDYQGTISKLENRSWQLEEQLADSRNTIANLRESNNKIRESNQLARRSILDSLESVGSVEGILTAIENAIEELAKAIDN